METNELLKLLLAERVMQLAKDKRAADRRAKNADDALAFNQENHWSLYAEQALEDLREFMKTLNL